MTITACYLETIDRDWAVQQRSAVKQLKQLQIDTMTNTIKPLLHACVEWIHSYIPLICLQRRQCDSCTGPVLAIASQYIALVCSS